MRIKIFSVAVAFLVAFASFAQTAQAQIQQAASETDHRLGVGAYLSAIPGGLVPSMSIDVSDRVTAVGTVGLYSGVTSASLEILGRGSELRRTNSKVAFEPYVGGGIVFTNVSYGFRPWTYSEAYVGLVVSGGTFMTVDDYQRWRFSGGLDWAGVDKSVSLSGVGLRVGAHYLF